MRMEDMKNVVIGNILTGKPPPKLYITKVFLGHSYYVENRRQYNVTKK